MKLLFQKEVWSAIARQFLRNILSRLLPAILCCILVLAYLIILCRKQIYQQYTVLHRQYRGCRSVPIFEFNATPFVNFVKLVWKDENVYLVGSQRLFTRLCRFRSQRRNLLRIGYDGRLFLACFDLTIKGCVGVEVLHANEKRYNKAFICKHLHRFQNSFIV